MTQFQRFCLVGTVGFVIDAGILQVLVVGAQSNIYASRLVSFLAAATATWWMNRRYTFGVQRQPSRAEWLRYIALMVLGAVINYGVYALCVTVWILAREQPWLAVALGSVAGLGANYATSSKLFRF